MKKRRNLGKEGWSVSAHVLKISDLRVEKNEDFGSQKNLGTEGYGYVFLLQKLKLNLLSHILKWLLQR